MIVDTYPVDPKVVRSKPQAGFTKALGSWSPIGTEQTSYCPGKDCIAKVPERVLVCHGCVGQVPDELLDAYQSTYVKGQNALTQSAENKAAYAAVVAHFAGLS